MMKIVIVNENDEVIGSKERESVTINEIYRVSALWITNSKGEILLARRALTKKKDPGLWGPAVAGTVDEGETYESSIIKEAEEELGLKNIKPVKSHKSRLKSPRNFFTQWFSLKLDKKAEDFDFNKEEVAEIKWFTEQELNDLIKKHPEKVIPSLVEGKHKK